MACHMDFILLKGVLSGDVPLLHIVLEHGFIKSCSVFGAVLHNGIKVIYMPYDLNLRELEINGILQCRYGLGLLLTASRRVTRDFQRKIRTEAPRGIQAVNSNVWGTISYPFR